MNATTIDTAALRAHADRIENSHPTIAARARAAADRIDAERAAIETLEEAGSVRLTSQDAAEKVAQAWNTSGNERTATVFPLAGGWVVATGKVREVSDEVRAKVAAFLGYR